MHVCVITHTIKYTLKYKPPWNNGGCVCVNNLLQSLDQAVAYY